MGGDDQPRPAVGGSEARIFARVRPRSIDPGDCGELGVVYQADPYDMHITWHAQAIVIIDANGNVLDMKGLSAS
ncbi:hypothetical protein AAH979_30895 [Plantactinospora sp. ZYX-F-223]|uniref:hypothetical protein n=1 Tax=Plantactinospora sp. ZYX-F-223 TaxID=3144103 RepID=UPI0031FD259D